MGQWSVNSEMGSVNHNIVVADANDCVSVFASHLLHSALDTAGLATSWTIASCVPPHRLRSADISKLPTHVRSIVPRVHVADPDRLASADLLVGFTGMQWPVVDHVRALHCPAPAVLLAEFIDDAERLEPAAIAFDTFSDSAMMHALTRSPSDASAGGAVTDDETWFAIADLSARFAQVLKRVSG